MLINPLLYAFYGIFNVFIPLFEKIDGMKKFKILDVGNSLE